MKIPKRGLEKFVKELVDMCTVSQRDRIQIGLTYENFAYYGAEQPQDAATFNKTWTYLGDLTSLMYSPASLRFNISDPDVPSLINEAKGRAAASKLKRMYRESDTDTLLSLGVFQALVRGKTFVKQAFKRESLSPTLVMPEAMGVLNESHTKLDEDMEAFTHSFLMTPYQLARHVWHNPDRETIIKKAPTYANEVRSDMSSADGAAMQVIVGGLYPYQPAGTGPTANKGIVNWLSGPTATMDPRISAKMIRVDELWVWDDDRKDWATFQIIGDKHLVMGKYVIMNAMAFNPDTGSEAEWLRGHHPFREICPNPMANKFWGRSEVINIIMLQYMLNKRINGINILLRKQEDPPKKFVGTAGVNQQALARFNKPGGYWADTNPNAKIEELTPTIPADLWNDLHEVERMFDEMGGLPPVARGRGEAGVRGAGHAETLIRMATPRLKDSALLVERDVEGIAAISLELGKAHVGKDLIAWVAPEAAGQEAPKPHEGDHLLIAPVKGQVPVRFKLADLDDDMTVTVDSHSSSPAFQQEARAMLFDLLKVQAITAKDVLERSDMSDADGLVAGLERREAAKAAEIEALKKSDPEGALKLLTGGKKH